MATALFLFVYAAVIVGGGGLFLYRAEKCRVEQWHHAKMADRPHRYLGRDFESGRCLCGLNAAHEFHAAGRVAR